MLKRTTIWSSSREICDSATRCHQRYTFWKQDQQKRHRHVSSSWNMPWRDCTWQQTSSLVCLWTKFCEPCCSDYFQIEFDQRTGSRSSRYIKRIDSQSNQFMDRRSNHRPQSLRIISTWAGPSPCAEYSTGKYWNIVVGLWRVFSKSQSRVADLFCYWRFFKIIVEGSSDGNYDSNSLVENTCSLVKS